MEETRIGKLYNMLMSFFSDGHTFNTIYKAKIDLSGTECEYHSWKPLKYWYMDEYHKNELFHIKRLN